MGVILIPHGSCLLLEPFYFYGNIRRLKVLESLVALSRFPRLGKDGLRLGVWEYNIEGHVTENVLWFIVIVNSRFMLVCDEADEVKTKSVRGRRSRGESSKPSEQRGSRWCFTLNNYSESEIQRLKEYECRFIIFGEERCPTTGTPHLQGYIELVDRVYLGALKRGLDLPRIHLERARGTADENISYCAKEERSVFRRGEPFTQQTGGSTTKSIWDDVWEAARSGDFDRIPKRIRLLHADAIRKVWAEEKWRAASTDKPCYQLRPWQSNLYGLYQLPASDREVVVIVDENGSGGKSWFAAYLQQLNPDGVLILRPGKHTDLLRLISLSPPARLYILDCPRCASERIPYDVIEQLKDGHIQSNKYDPVVRRMPSPHVWIFTNADPIRDNLSADRWNVIKI